MSILEAALRNKESSTTNKGYERAGTILTVARQILVSEGYAALSMRSVAVGAGISLSTVQHYYPSREALIEALLLQTFNSYQAAIDQRMASLGDGSKLDLFNAVIEYFLEELSDQVSTGLFFEVSALANRHAFASQFFDTMLTRARKTLRNLIRDMVPSMSAQQCEVRGALIVSQMIGLMLFISEVRPKHKELAELRKEATAAIMRIALAS
ncbi:MAG: TetR/AcrR family transcriptional regulator [Burkholderiaceae bacterium]|nr:TetR/AcrR family transcriptional regulator [Burkholderiaceae bacterium]